MNQTTPRRLWLVTGVDGYGDLLCLGPGYMAELPQVFELAAPWETKPHIASINAPRTPRHVC